MHEIYELKDMLLKELEQYGSKKDISAGTLDVVDKLAHTVKNLCKIIEAGEEEEYSQRGGQGGRYSYNYSRRNYYDGNRGGNYSREGGSYARGRQNARRDSMGRYSSEGGYSRADGVEEMLETVRDMMQELPPEIQQEAQKFVKKLEQQM